jgi:hypothetical protein
MKKNYTEIVIVLDRSGSMESVRDDTIGGFNAFLAAQKKVPGECKITLAQFDHEYEVRLNAARIADALLLDTLTYVPRGSTALYGAIGRTIDEAGRRFAAMPESERPEKVICVIITDGQENHSPIAEWSRMYTAELVRERIERQTNAYKWEFVYIGANQDAILIARGMGMNVNNAMNYTSNAIGTQCMYAAVTDNVTAVRLRSKADMSWTKQQLEEQEAAK